MPTPFRLRPDDAVRYAAFRLRMLTEAPWAFAGRPDNDFAVVPERVAAFLAEREHAIVAVAEGRAARGEPAAADPLSPLPLVAAAGIVRMTAPQYAHRARLWGVFVDASRRGHGLGRAVVTAALDVARTWSGLRYVDLGVSANAPEAQRLYARLGFREWGREPETTRHESGYYDEVHMSLKF